MNSDWWRICG